jgi:hypothetical protein
MTRFPRVAVTVTLLSLILAALTLAAGTLRAQMAQPQQPQLLMINEIQLAPGSTDEWTEMQKSEQIPAQKKGGIAWRETWASAIGNPRARAIVTPLSSLADLDGPAPIVKVLGEQGAAAYRAKSAKLIAGGRSYILRTRPDLGFGTRPAEYKLAILTVASITNGHAAEFENLLKTDVVPALKKANVTYYVVGQIVYGGDANEFRTLIPVENFAELAKGLPLERALGPEGMAKLGQKTAPMVTHLERTIIRFVPELSYRSGSTSH